MINPQEIELPYPTSATIKGAIVVMAGDILELFYDYAGLDAPPVWGRLRFREVLAYQWLSDVCCSAEHILRFDSMRASADSAWLTELLDRWDRLVEWRQYQEELGGRKRFRHYRVYFDELGCLDVVASSVEFERDASPPATESSG